MRDIALAAGVSLGATYHHFASKDAIALALFEEHLERHRALVADAIATEPSFARRLAATLEASLDARAGDRVVLAFLAKVVLDSTSEASLFHPNTQALRVASIGVFQDVVTCAEIPDDARPLLAVALWAMHLAVLLRFVLEETPGQPRTRALVRGIGELAPPVVALLASPMMIPLRTRLVEVLTQAGLDLEALTRPGETVTDTDVITEPTLVYFGYTFCPDICPFDMARNAEAVDVLAERGYSATPVFISIDPARDTPEAVGDFASNLHDKAIGLTGSPEQVKAAAGAYRTYYKAQDSGDEFYLVDHMTFTYLVLPDEGFVDFFRREATPEQMADTVACYIDAS